MIDYLLGASYILTNKYKVRCELRGKLEILFTLILSKMISR